MADKKDDKKDSKEEVLVEFFGPGREVTERIVNASDFSRNQVTGKKLVFDVNNGWTQDVSDLNKNAVEWLVSNPDFRLKEDAPAEA